MSIIGIKGRGAVAIDDLVIRSDPNARPPDAKLPAPHRTWKSPGKTTYYVDSVGRSDSADGTSAAAAWKTLAKVNTGQFAPGDRVKIKEGSFQNFEGNVDNIDETKGIVTVLLTIFGRSTPVDVEYWQLEKL